MEEGRRYSQHPVLQQWSRLFFFFIITQKRKIKLPSGYLILKLCHMLLLTIKTDIKNKKGTFLLVFSSCCICQSRIVIAHEDNLSTNIVSKFPVKRDPRTNSVENNALTKEALSQEQFILVLTSRQSFMVEKSRQQGLKAVAHIESLI